LSIFSKERLFLKKVTLSDVAREVGVHHSTVSRALKNHLGIPEKTKTKILAAVQKLGYVPDPHLSALAAYKNSQRPVGFVANLAWITNFPTEEGWRENPHFVAYYEGAKARAAELGYGLEIFWLRSLVTSGKLPSHTFSHRGIRGLLFCPQPSPKMQIDLDWELFSPVGFGYTLAQPGMHNVALDHFRSTQKLMQELYALGYRRPRLFLSHESDARVNYAWSSGFECALRQLSLPAHGVVYLPKPDPSQLVHAVKKHQPDVLLATRGWAQQALLHLPKEGYKIPQSLGVAAVNAAVSDTDLGGILELGQLVGSHGVDMVSAMLSRGEHNIPSNIKHMVTDGEFRIGETLREIRT
jgi:DNA-binding LacI/PurR family transcriptional regulator